MIKRVAAVAATSAVALLAVGGVTAYAATDHSAHHRCAAERFRVPGLAPAESLAAGLRLDHREYFTNTVALRYDAHSRWATVTVVPKHC